MIQNESRKAQVITGFTKGLLAKMGRDAAVVCLLAPPSATPNGYVPTRWEGDGEVFQNKLLSSLMVRVQWNPRGPRSAGSSANPGEGLPGGSSEAVLLLWVGTRTPATGKFLQQRFGGSLPAGGLTSVGRGVSRPQYFCYSRRNVVCSGNFPWLLPLPGSGLPPAPGLAFSAVACAAARPVVVGRG